MKDIKLDYDTLPNGKSEVCNQCCSMIDSEQSYYFNSNSNEDLYFDHPSCVELYYLTNQLESI